MGGDAPQDDHLGDEGPRQDAVPAAGGAVRLEAMADADHAGHRAASLDDLN